MAILAQLNFTLRQHGPNLVMTLGHRALFCTIWSAIGPYQIHCFERSVSYQLTGQRAKQFVRLLEYLIERTVGLVQWVDYVGYALM